MRILGPGAPIIATSPREAGRPSGAPSFSAPLKSSGGAPASTALGAAAPLASLDALLALQELPDPTERRRRALRRGHRLLDHLDELRLALIDGEIPLTTLQGLRGQLRQRGDLPDDDPLLAALLGEIELRVEVELAKLEVGMMGEG
jgi:hypothetical protein